MKKWNDIGGREAAAFAHASGLTHLPDCMLPHPDASLITSFIERWHPETNSFHMPWGEMTITLHDVYYILGLPISGVMVKHGVRTSTLADMIGEHLSISPDEVKAEIGGGGLKASSLQDCTLAAHVAQDSKAIFYLLHLLGSTVFVDKTQDRVSAFIFPLLEELNSVSKYAWGAAVLAHMYRQLGMASRAGCRQFSGCATLLEVTHHNIFESCLLLLYILILHNIELFETGLDICILSHVPSKGPPRLVSYGTPCYALARRWHGTNKIFRRTYEVSC